MELTLNAMGLGSAVKFSRSKCTEGLCEMRCLCLWKCRKERKWERWMGTTLEIYMKSSLKYNSFLGTSRPLASLLDIWVDEKTMQNV